MASEAIEGLCLWKDFVIFCNSFPLKPSGPLKTLTYVLMDNLSLFFYIIMIYIFKEENRNSARRSSDKCQPNCQEVCTPNHLLKEPQHHRRQQGGSMRSPIMAASWAERYR